MSRLLGLQFEDPKKKGEVIISPLTLAGTHTDIEIEERLGLEWELTMYDLLTMLPASGEVAQEVIGAVSETSELYKDRLSAEPPKHVWEVKTAPPVPNVTMLNAQTREMLLALQTELERRSAGLLSISVEPLYDLISIDLTHEFLKTIIGAKHGWACSHRANTMSLQINVQVLDADALLFVCNVIRLMDPVLLAATANSPLDRGRRSGFMAFRPNKRKIIHDTGIHPPLPNTWEEYWSVWPNLTKIGITMTQVWAHNLNLRFRPDRACVEVSIMDAPVTLMEAMGIAELIRRVVLHLQLLYRESGLGAWKAIPPEMLCYDHPLAVMKSLQEAALHGTDSEQFFAFDGELVTAMQAFQALKNFAQKMKGTDPYADQVLKSWAEGVARDGPPAKRLLELHQQLHPDCNHTVNKSCALCAQATRQIIPWLMGRFDADLRGDPEPDPPTKLEEPLVCSRCDPELQDLTAHTVRMVPLGFGQGEEPLCEWHICTVQREDAEVHRMLASHGCRVYGL